MSDRTTSRMTRSRTLHDDAVAAYVARARALEELTWSAPLQPGKWSPAEITQHLTLTFEVLTRELRGGPGMRVRVKPLKRLLLRLTLVRRMLRGGPFPRGAPAPRELRPEPVPGVTREDALAAMTQRAAAFVELAGRTHAAGRPRSLTHAYFGAMSLPDAMLMSARHVEHHTRQLRGEL
jgi:hypothetical protein